MSKFTFGTPTTTASTTGFGFNTQTPAAGGFSAPTFGASTPAAGAAAAAAAAGVAAAAQTTAPALNFSFGTAQPQAAATQAAQPSNLFGTGAATTSSNLFSTAAAQAQPTLGQQPQLGQPAQSTGLTFGTPASSAAGLKPGTFTGLTTTTATTGGLNFGTTQATGTLSFGTTSQAPGLTFGTPSTATTGPKPASGLMGLGTTSTTTGALGFGTTQAAGSLSFGTTTTATTAPASSVLSFGAPATTNTSSLFTSSTGGLFGAKPATTTAAPTTTTTTNRGLGGLDVSVSNKGLAQGNTSPTAAKENLVPNELTQTIDNFKEFVKTQKVLSSDIARGSARPLNRCAEDTASLMEILTTLAGSVQRDRSLADKLKQDTAKALQNAEIAQRTHDTPAGLQYENNAPLLFFMELAENFENDLMLFKSQIETTEKYIQTMMSPKTLTPQELTMAMNKLHESLVAVAGRLQSVDAKVQQQKEQYLNFRKYVLKDSTNVFEDIKTNGKSNRSGIGKVTSGPTPFGPGNRSFLSSTALNSSQTPNYGTPNPLGLARI